MFPSPNRTEDSKKVEMIKKRSFATRLNIFFFVTFILFCVLIVRLAGLQLVMGEEFAGQEDRTKLRTNTIPPIRGDILDREGYPIAYSTSTQSLYYTYSNDTAENLVGVARNVSKLLDYSMTAAEVLAAMDAGYNMDQEWIGVKLYSYVPRLIKFGLSDQQLAYFVEHHDEFPSFDILEESVRHYDDQAIAVQLVGYVRQFSTAMNQKESYLDYYKDEEITAEYLNNEMVGLDGLEFMYQDVLRGKNGYKSYLVNAADTILGDGNVQNPTKGSNLILTIDKDVQLAAQQAIMDHLELLQSPEALLTTYRYGAEAKSGYAVAMEIDTGKVVAMAGMPDYPPSVWNNGRISTDDWNEYQYRFKNGAISERYSDFPDDDERAKHPTSLVYLGSTMKPLTILLGLKEGLFGINEKYMDIGEFVFGADKSKIKNSGGQYNGLIDAEDAIRLSSNTFMSAMIGERLSKRSDGLDIWDRYMKLFGLGVSTESGLPNESVGIRDYEHEAKVASPLSALVRASWGQQGKYTTLQLAQYAAMLANRGERLKPQFVERIIGPNGEVQQEFEKEVLNTVEFKEEYWDLVQRGMLQVFRTGFDGFPYEVAAKTGTSTQAVPGGQVDNAVFIAYAPADNPKLAVAVVVPEGGYGAWGAAPIARKIFDAYDEEIGLTGVPRGSEQAQ